MKDNKRNDKIIGLIFIFIMVLIIGINVITKDKKTSEKENRGLTQKPDITVSGILSGSYMEDFESYMSDQFPGRNLWRKVETGIELVGGSKEENGVFRGKKRQLMEDIAAPNEEALSQNIAGVDTFSKNHGDISTSIILVPDSACILKNQLPAFATTYNQEKMISSVKEKLNSDIKWIDAVSVLKNQKDKKIYYKTDPHWTTLGTYYVFLEAAKTLGIETKEDLNPLAVTKSFNGTLSSKSGFYEGANETIEIYFETEETEVVVNYIDEQKKRATLYDSSKLETKDKYAVFLGGNSSIIDIKTSSESDKTLLLIKDSFANSFIPFLTPYYKEIIVVDPRYYFGTMEDVFETYSITDTMFLYSGSTFSQDRNMEGLFSVK